MLLDRLSAAGPLSIAQLTVGTNLTRQAITKHLHVLAHARLVRDVRHRREHIYELDPARLSLARRSLDQISQQWSEAVGCLRKFVEE